MLYFKHLKKNKKIQLIATSILSASLLGLFATSAPADETTPKPTGSIDIPSFIKDTRTAYNEEIERTVTINLEAVGIQTATGKFIKPEKLDVLFLADNTGSMKHAIANVKDHAQDLLNKLGTEYSDVEFGVAFYRADPTEYGSHTKTYNKKVGQETITLQKEVVVDTRETTEMRQDYKTIKVGEESCTETYEYLGKNLNRIDTPYQYKIRTIRDSDGKVVKSKKKWKADPNLDGHSKSCTLNITEEVPDGAPYEVTVIEPIMGFEDVEKKVDIKEKTTIADKAYQVLDPVAEEGVPKNDTINAIKAIKKWKAKDEWQNKDFPEAGFFALHQAATNGASTPSYSGDPDAVYSTGYDTGWRADADMKLVVMFGDAKSHTGAVNQLDAIKALEDNDVTVIMINIDTITGTLLETNEGMSVANDGLDASGQASAIVKATQGKYADVDNSTLVSLLDGPPIDYSDSYCDSLTALDLVCTILGSVGDAAVVPEMKPTKINIDFDTNNFNPITSNTSEPLSLSMGPFSEDGLCIGYDTCVKYECTDPLGCNEVVHQEKRKFKMIFQGQIPAIYNFDTVVVDDSGNNITGAISTNSITIYNID